MKHIFLASALFISALFSTQAHAATGKDNPAVQQSFSSTFNGARDVMWTVTNNLYKVSFTYNGQAVAAFYNADGTQLALTRNIATGQLPLPLQASLKKQYSSYWVSDLFEINNDSGVHYYITLETGDTKLVLKSEPGFSWAQFQKTKKA